jgi:hypothetical protein
MITRFKVDFIPPPGEGAEPFQTEFEDARPSIRLPDVGERFAFIDPWGRRQAGQIVARQDLGMVVGETSRETKHIAVTVRAFAGSAARDA